jgi:hypothetical protein
VITLTNGDVMIARPATAWVERLQRFMISAVLNHETLNDIGRDVNWLSASPSAPRCTSGLTRRLRSNQQSPKHARRKRRALPKGSRTGRIQSIRPSLQHQPIRCKQMFEALRDTPPRRVRSPVQLPRVQAAEGHLRVSSHIVERDPQFGK